MKITRPAIVHLTQKAIACSIAILIFGSAYAQRITQPFDKDWRFFKGDATGASETSFSDAAWRTLDVPHDWSIEGPYDKNNPTNRGGGYLPAGIGWYRKSFTLDNSYKDKKITIEFDGIMANSEVWINGFHLGKRPYGYSSLSYDLSGHLNIGNNKPNIIAVKADNTIQPASRYYRGAGIYRHVRLVATQSVHFDHWGVFVTTPQVSAQKAVVNVKSRVVNQSAASAEYVIETTILDPTGKKVNAVQTKQSIAAGKTADVSQDIEVTSPALWSLEQPSLYKAVTRIRNKQSVVDNDEATFGIRTARFDAATGFWLNDKNIKLKGVCLHHDGGAVGAAVPVGVWKRRLEHLREAGTNAIRTSHNPVAPEFLDLCDQMGFVVMDETFDTWTAGKPNGEMGYNLYFTEWWERDTRDMIMRDRNHPSIVIYSVGNEIHDNLNNPEGFKKYKDQQDLIHQLDGTRPVTMALFRPANSKVYTNGFAETMDVVGQNYRENELVAAHEAHPDWKVIGTENGHTLSAWLPARDKPYMTGQFLWTGYDYLGEANWPNTTNNSGLFTRTNEWKPNGLQRQSWWSEKPVVHIVRREENAGTGGLVANWTPSDMGTYDNATLQVYSNCSEVELFLNDKSLGSKPKPENDSPRVWETTFEKGKLKAVGKNNGKVVATEELTTAGSPAKIRLTADQASLVNNWDDVVFITAVIVDANGIVCPNEDTKIEFKLNGPGEIVAVDNGNLASHDTYKATAYPAYRGKCIAIVKAKANAGKLIISASGEGLGESNQVEIQLR